MIMFDSLKQLTLDIVERENKTEKEGERERDTCILTNEGKQR